MKTDAGDKWRSALGLWAIPKEILDQATESPWIHPPTVFQLPATIQDSPSHRKAREVSPQSFLDIGCGGGIAAFATDASLVIGVDHQPEMLKMFRENALQKSREVQVFEGFWPEISSEVPKADVVAAHHVLYNVQEVEDFLLAMNSHAQKRVVIEIPQRHPQSPASGMWKHFWNIDRPTVPSPDDLMDVISSLDISAECQLWEGPLRRETDIDQEAEFSRIRLCLPESRRSEVKDYLESHPSPDTRPLATIWWDVN